MTNTAVYQAPKSSETYIKTEYYPATDGVATEFQCDQLWEVEQLLCELQKACLALSYFSCAKLFSITCSAIFKHIRRRLSMIFGQSM